MNQSSAAHIPLPLEAFLSQHFTSQDYRIEPLPISGSSRRYVRVFYNNTSTIAAYNEHVWENEVFFRMTKHFLNKQLPVPKILSISDCQQVYLLQDLGDITLASLLPKEGIKDMGHTLIKYYQKALTDLVRFQIEGREGYDWTYTYPIDTMNEKAIRWDLNYFKYYFLHVSGMHYNEKDLEEAFDDFIHVLLQFDNDYLMFRDFQSRNIMIQHEDLYYIDYQGARKGVLTYDVVSLLFQAKAKIKENVREKLFRFYLDELKKRINIDEQKLISEFYYIALLRNLQTLGAYGFRGLIQKKTHFLESIQSGLNNLTYLLNKLQHKKELQPLLDILHQMINH